MATIKSFPRLKESFPTANSLFDFTYPYGTSKTTIENMIYNHFASYRLSRLNKTDWKTLYFAPRMNEIMPKFNKLYASADLIISPLQNMNWTEGHSYSETLGRDDILTNDLSEVIEANTDTSATNATSGYTNGNCSSTESKTSDTDKSNTNKYSDTPQGSVTNITNGYLTNVTLNDDTSATTETSATGGSTNSSYVDSNSATGASESESTKTNTGTASRDIDETRSGSRTITHTGLFKESPAKLMEEYRKTIIDINSMLLNELASMFLQVYDWDDDDEEVEV